MKLLKRLFLTSFVAGSQFIPATACAQWDMSLNSAPLNSAPLPNVVRPGHVNLGPQGAFSVLSNVSHTRTTAQSSSIVSLSDGILKGKIMQLDENTRETNQSIRANLRIFLMQEGKIAHQTESGSDGSFEMEDVQPGAYSFVATGKAGFTAYGLVVTDQEDGKLNVLEGAAVSIQTAGLKEILEQRLPPQIVRQITDQNVSKIESNTNAGSAKVRLIRGQLNGSISSFDSRGESMPTQGSIINLIRNGQRVADVEADTDGNFVVEDLEPGVYDFIAVGHKGIAALRFEAVGQESPMTTVSFRKPKLVAATLDVALTIPQDSQLISQSVRETNLESDSRTETQFSKTASYEQIVDRESRAQHVGFGGAQGPHYYNDGEVYLPSGGGMRSGRVMSGGRLPAAAGITLGIIGVSRNPRSASPSR